MASKKPDLNKGCEFCGDFPVILSGRCHPSAPLRAVMEQPGELTLRCYIPECDRVVATLKIAGLA